MRATRPPLLIGLLLAAAGITSTTAAVGAGAAGDDGPDEAGAAMSSWSRWQGRVSLGANAFPASGAWQGSTASDPNSRRAGGSPSLSLLGDYYFARPFDLAGGFRATSGLIVGPRSQALSIAQPNLAAGSLFSVDSRGFAPPPGLRRRDPLVNEASVTLPYLGFGYTGRAARGALSLSADFGLLGGAFGESAGRSFGTSLRSLDDTGRDSNGSRLLPVLQLGMLYSF